MHPKLDPTWVRTHDLQIISGILDVVLTAQPSRTSCQIALMQSDKMSVIPATFHKLHKKPSVWIRYRIDVRLVLHDIICVSNNSAN